MLASRASIYLTLGCLGALAGACFESKHSRDSAPDAATSRNGQPPTAAETSQLPAKSVPGAPTRDLVLRPAAPLAREVKAGNSEPAAPSTGSEPAAPPDADPASIVPPRGVRIAFLGDQSLGLDALAVLQLIKRENAQAIVHAGDFAYEMGTPRGWEEQIDAVLGRDFPYFVAVGNHDTPSWAGAGGYAELLTARVGRTPEIKCSGEFGVKALCRFRGVTLVLSGIGTYGEDHEAFLEKALAQSTDMPFRVCVWHKNQADMQVGAKTDEVGWEAYRICARHGALIVTAHEHSYARTRLLSAIGDRGRGHGAIGKPGELDLAPNRTAVVVTGLGGHSARPRTDEHAMDSWWASIYAQNFQLDNGEPAGRLPNIRFGALFIDFFVDGDPFRARAWFKTVDGEVHDRFNLTTPRP